jgi:hypothetical protein
VRGASQALLSAAHRPKPMPRSWIDYLFRRPRLTFVLMGAFFLLFGVTTVNLFVLLKLNIDLFLDYGLMVVADGALEQLIDLLASAYLSMAFWLLFKVCERILVERVTAKRFGPRRGRGPARQA